MSYVVIARRWRPQQFDEVIGQEHVSRTLANAIANNRIAHAYIFSGPRGVGKTTTARILAKAVNCEKGPTPTPCNECASCKAITQGNSLDVVEIDGASNRGIDEIRNLREKIRFAPAMGKYRVYIIDEVHMLTKEAFNALLKTLEEPPEHVIFIFATTEIHRVPATILSRCQRFDFRRIAVRTIMEHLQRICKAEKIEIEEEALLQIAKKADGSMRDAESILDQIISYAGTKITFEDVVQALGVIHQDFYFKLTDQIKNAAIKDIILSADTIFETGHDLNEFLLGFEEHLRNILVIKSTGSTKLIDTSENYLERYKQLANEFSENDLVGYLQTVGETINVVKSSQQPQLKFELGLIKLAKMPKTAQIDDLLHQIELLKKKATNILTAQPQAVQEPAPHVQAFDFNFIKNQWKTLIEKIGKSRASLAGILTQAKIESFNGKTLTLTCSEQGEIVRGEKEWLERFLKQELEHTIRLQFNILKKPKRKAPQKTVESKKETLKKIVNASESMRKLVDEFGLEIF